MTPERLEKLRQTFHRQQYLADAAGELLREMTSLSEENVALRAENERLRAVLAYIRGVWEEPCEDPCEDAILMGRKAAEALDEVGQ
jgi:regulator of replication initiation timing